MVQSASVTRDINNAHDPGLYYAAQPLSQTTLISTDITTAGALRG